MEKYLYLKGYLKGISMEKYPISKDISRISPWRNISISKDIAESHHGEVSISQRISLESLHRELSYLKGYNYFKNLPMEKYMYVYIKEYLKSLRKKVSVSERLSEESLCCQWLYESVLMQIPGNTLTNDIQSAAIGFNVLFLDSLNVDRDLWEDKCKQRERRMQ